MYCKKCVLPDSYTNIQIDNAGVCNLCRNHKKTNYLGKDQLLKDIQEYLALNKSDKYDCVVGFSGGRDSTYLLWYVVKVLKLRALAVFSDDLFIPQTMLDNIKTTTDILGVDLLTVRHDYLKKCVKHHLGSWIKRPVAETLMFINVGERLGYLTLVEKQATRQGVHVIFSGGSPFQQETYKTDLLKLNKCGGKIN